MDISIEHLSRLARLSLSDDEMKLFGDQLNGILLYMEKLNELDTTGVEPTSHVILLRNVDREDSPRPSLSRDEALMNAPDRTDRFYRVPKIIE
ncbi:MAG: Asp-tRNA(Asn)/Glu-tRNA(Gln) amidotransferase subunit GatC [Candidatus Sulfobium sp.]|jgi:aspartyl-tRNA(Asn)/glutamyl-tRNA(Gln) amidotransferase subunit C